MQTLKGRICVMAGATAGDGRDTVKALCQGGMTVILMTHNPEAAGSLIEEVRNSGAEGKCVMFEGTGMSGPAEEQEKAYELIAAKYGSVDVIISNTGGNGKAQAIDNVSGDELMKDTEHLLKGSFNMMKAALPFLKKSVCPRVIFMTTVEACSGGTHESFTNAVAKGAVRTLTLVSAQHLAASGITVNAIAKGAIPRVEPMREGDADPALIMPYIPQGRLGTPEDLAQAICFFASEESSYITGQILNVSGGWK